MKLPSFNNIICATGVNPPNLQGIWGGTVTPPWSSDFTTNGNLPVAVSHYLQANTPELMLPLFDKLESLYDDFRTNAKVLFGCRGIYISSHFASHGLNNHFDATWPMTFWTVGAAWYAMFYYDYYLYTLDKEFLRKRALPFMEDAALFYEDFLIEGEDGKLVFCPSYSPENNLVSTHDPGGTFNVDISGGYPSLIMKMLVYSDIGTISLLPALPDVWQTGSLKGAALRGGIILEDLKWNDGKVEAVIVSKIDQKITITVCNNDTREVNLKADQPFKFTNY